MIKNIKNTIKVSNIYIAAFLILSTAACKKTTIKNEIESEVETKVTFAENIETTLQLKTNEALTLKPEIKGNAIKYEWMESDKVIATEKFYLFNRDTPGDYALTLNVTNSAGTSTLKYAIKVRGKYADGILLLSSTDINGTGGGNISYLDENEKLKLDVFAQENNGAKLSASTMGAFRYGNQLYVSSTSGPNYINVIDDETLKSTSHITVSGITGVTYFATTDGKNGYINSSTRKKLGLYPVDLTAKNIGGTLLTGTTDATLLPITTVNNAILSPAAKQLIKVEGGVAQNLFTYTDNVAGVVKTSNKQIWVGVTKGTTTKAKLIRLDENFSVQETIELDNTFRLPPNGMLTASGASEFIYWQETSTGEFCRFNAITKNAEKFVSPANDGLSFSTAWKVNPKTGDVYIIDSPGIFTGLDSSSDLYIYSSDKKLRKKITKVGYQVVDVIFPK